MRRKLLAITLFAASLLIAQESTEEDPPVCCSRGPHPSRVDVRHLEYQGLGFNKGYTTLGIFLANAEPWFENNYAFLDLRGHVFNDGKPALNAGFGWRYLFDSGCHAVGLNTYYDYRKTHHKYYNQVGLGLEYLTPRLEFRANGYLPFGAQHSRYFDLEFDHFAGNQFFVRRKHEFAMTGCDTEVGWHFKHWRHFDFFAGIGPYYFKGYLGKAAIGAKARLKAQITPYVALEVGDSYDQVFRNRFHAELTLSIPFGPRTKPKLSECCSCKRQNMLQEWLHNPPNRDEIIVVDTQKKTSVAIDPGTGLPFFLWFVNNTSSSNGTFESPFPTLAMAEAASKPGDIIYVFPGNGTTTGMAAGIVLKDSQRLLGSGVSHGFNTTVGYMAIPRQTIPFPAITNGAAVVTLALNNEVAGLYILNGTTGVLGSWTGQTTTALIDRNFFVNNGSDSVSLAAISSQAHLEVNENTILHSGGNGVSCAATMGSLAQTKIQNNIISNPLLDCIFLDCNDSGTELNSQVLGNTIYSRTDALPPMFDFFAVHARTQGDALHRSLISDNRILSDINGSIRQGIYVEAAGVAVGVVATTVNSRTFAEISHNTIQGINNGIFINTVAGGAGPIEIDVHKNSLSFVSSTSTLLGQLNATIQVTGNGSGLISGAIHNNKIIENPNLGIASIARTGSTLALNYNENLIQNCQRGGISATVQGAITIGRGFFRFENNIIEECGGDVAASAVGMNIVVSDDGYCSAKVINNRFNHNLNGDFLVQVQALATPGTLCIQLQDNVSSTSLSLVNLPGVGTIQLEPSFNNTAGIIFGGTITQVPAGTCQ